MKNKTIEELIGWYDSKYNRFVVLFRSHSRFITTRLPAHCCNVNFQQKFSFKFENFNLFVEKKQQLNLSFSNFQTRYELNVWSIEMIGMAMEFITQWGMNLVRYVQSVRFVLTRSFTISECDLNGENILHCIYTDIISTLIQKLVKSCCLYRAVVALNVSCTLYSHLQKWCNESSIVSF